MNDFSFQDKIKFISNGALHISDSYNFIVRTMHSIRINVITLYIWNIFLKEGGIIILLHIQFCCVQLKTKVSRCTHYVYNDIEINISSLVSQLTYYSFSTLLFLRSGLSYQGNLSKHQSFDIKTIRRLIIFIPTDPFMCVKKIRIPHLSISKNVIE